MTFTITFDALIEQNAIIVIYTTIIIATIPFDYSLYFFFSCPFSRMNIHVVYGILLFSLPLTLTSNQNAIIKNLGDISFFEKTWTHTHDIDLKDYVENAIVLQNATDNLIKICGKTPDDTNCKYFQKNIEKNAAMAQKEIN